MTYIPLPPTSTGPIFDFLFADLDSTGWDSAGAALTRQIGSNRVDECCIPRFGAGEYALETGRLALAERAAQDLLSVPRALPRRRQRVLYPRERINTA